MILVVDDLYSISASVRHALANRGFTVLHAESPEEGLTHWRAHQPQIELVVIDMVSPSAGNLDMAADLERLWPSLPVLYLMGARKAGDYCGIHADGAGSVLSKPFTEEELIARVKSLLNPEAADGQSPDEDLWERLIADSNGLSSGGALLYVYEPGQAALASCHVNILLKGRIRCAFRPTNYALAPYSMVVHAPDLARARRLIARAWIGGQSASAIWALT